MKKDNRKKIAQLGLIAIFITSYAYSANLTQIGRYATVDNKPMAAQINPLLTIQQIHFPQSVASLGDAINYWLRFSGYSLIDESGQSEAMKTMLNMPLPAVDRNLGPLSIQDGLEVLAGSSVFSLNTDALYRKVDFTLKPKYAKAFQTKKVA